MTWFGFEHQALGVASSRDVSFDDNKETCDFTSQNHDMIMRDDVLEGLGNLDGLVFLTTH